MENGDIAPITLSWPSSALLVAFRFAAAGHAVSMPLHPQMTAYDLVVDVAGQLRRVQIKRARWRKARQRKAGWGDRAGFTVGLTRHTKGRPHRRLRRAEFDYLCVVCDPQTIYVLPVACLVRVDGGDELVGHMEFKPPIDNGRKDSEAAAARWTLYLNQFRLVP